MAIDLLNLQPSVISKDLAGKFILLAGAPEIFGHLTSNGYLNCSKNWNPEMGIRAEVNI